MPDASSQAITFDAEWLMTMDGPPIHHGRVCIEGSTITAVGPFENIAVHGRHIQLGRSILMPGLVNAHCHLELSAYRGVLPPSDLWTWLRRLVMLRMEPGATAKEQAAVPAAVQSMMESGTTCVGDISRSDWLPRMLAGLPIRKVCYVELISGAMSPPANMAQLQERLAQVPEDDPLLIPAVSPHAPYTVTGDDLRSCMHLAAEQRLPLAIHLAETADEIEWLRRGTGTIAQWHQRLFKNPPRWPGTGATQYVTSVAAAVGQPAGTALIHMNYADDWQLLCQLPEDRRPAIVYCPRSHRFFGHAPHPFLRMLEAGLTVAIGTDSAASHAPDETRPLSVLDELRWLWKEMSASIPAETLLEIATVGGAMALGLGNKTGRIAAGLQADIVAFDAPNQEIVNPAAAVLDAAPLPSLVCISGQIMASRFPIKIVQGSQT